jgi:hypothetical protein
MYSNVLPSLNQAGTRLARGSVLARATRSGDFRGGMHLALAGDT